MNTIEELIQKECPEGVEFKKFFELCDFIRGVTYNKSKEVLISGEDSWKVLRANNITLGSNELNFDDVKEIKKDVKVKDSQLLKEGDILICAGSGSKEHVGKVAYIYQDMDYTFGGFMGVIRHNEKLISRYLFHVMTSSSFKNYLNYAINSTTINNLNSQVMEGFEIPVPPLSVQHKIVEILDKFTSLEAELEAELEARKKQYEYYRNQLLDFTGREDVEWKTLGEIANLFKGPYITKKESKEGIYPVVMGGQEAAYFIDKFNSKGDSIVISRSGVNAGFVSFWKQPIFVSDGYRIDNLDLIDKLYLYYYLKNEEPKINASKKGAGVPHVQSKSLLKLTIPIPPLSEQHRIVTILDKFEELINGQTASLAAEIKARHQQYEYYRDRLLTFSRKEN